MKRAIAICLLVICIALPLISYAVTASTRCPYCKRTNTIPIDYDIFYTPYDSTRHTTYVRFLLICTDCGKAFTTDCEIAKDPHSNLTHHTQVLGLHLVREYDTCGLCGATVNEHTYYN